MDLAPYFSPWPDLTGGPSDPPIWPDTLNFTYTIDTGVKYNVPLADLAEPFVISLVLVMPLEFDVTKDMAIDVGGTESDPGGAPDPTRIKISGDDLFGRTSAAETVDILDQMDYLIVEARVVNRLGIGTGGFVRLNIDDPAAVTNPPLNMGRINLTGSSKVRFTKTQMQTIYPFALWAQVFFEKGQHIALERDVAPGNPLDITLYATLKTALDQEL
jgi:hypothetical protein